MELNVYTMELYISRPIWIIRMILNWYSLRSIISVNYYTSYGWEEVINIVTFPQKFIKFQNN
jgi:hypothetical protein